MDRFGRNKQLGCNNGALLVCYSNNLEAHARATM